LAMNICERFSLPHFYLLHSSVFIWPMQWWMKQFFMSLLDLLWFPLHLGKSRKSVSVCFETGPVLGLLYPIVAHLFRSKPSLGNRCCELHAEFRVGL
jgi:hypothetical protein